VINTAVSQNATLVADNIFTGEGSIGLYGRSRGAGFSIGVLGQSPSWCAIYGPATDDLSPGPDPQPTNGIRVVGRSMGAETVESTSVEEIVQQQIGVLGHSVFGPGVRGHSGSLVQTPPPPHTPPLPTVAEPGGVFSAGQLTREPIMGSAHNSQLVSTTSESQLRLTPSTASLPPSAGVGDFFLRIPPFTAKPPVGTNEQSHSATLWICTSISAGTPNWQQVQFVPGPPTPG
jgi:hypothetical protein